MDNNKKYLFLENGLLLASMAYFSNFAMGIANRTLFNTKELALIAAISLGGGYLLDKLFKDSQYEKLFRLCGIENKDKKVPLVINKEKQGNKTTLVLNVPEGLSQKQFEEKQIELEQNLNAKIEYGFNKNLIMKLQEMNLGTKYDYEFEQCEDPTKVFIGYSHEGKFILDIEDCPHIIIAGETRSGKTSVETNIILSLILSKYKIQLHLVDFQAAGLGKFENCKKVKSYSETPTEFDKLLDYLEEESNRRLKLYKSVSNKVYIEKLSQWNNYFPERYLEPIIVVIDEFARLNEKTYEDIHEKFRDRISSDAKAGIYYVISMQRPDVTVIRGSTKANVPTRMAFKVVTQTDSEVILDQKGAEKIKNPGRFLIKYCGDIKEVQALYIEPEDVRSILKKHKAFKTTEEIELEKQQAKKKQIADFHKKFNNPYGGGYIDN